MTRSFQSLGELGEWLGAQRAADGPLWVADPGIPLSDYGHPGHQVWSSQPSVRKVVDFIARNVASIPLHLHERRSDDDRPRVTDHPLAATLSRPSSSPGETAFRFWHGVLADWLIHDRWAAMKVPGEGRTELRRIPARRFRFVTDGLEQVVAVKVWSDNGRAREYDPDRFVFDRGYGGAGGGTSPIVAISYLLEEAAEAVAYRRSVWKRGARVPLVLERDRPWSSDQARERFERGWANFTRGGGREGGTPILDDGMKATKLEAFSPQDTQDLEGRKLTDIEVASFYHLAPELVGAREGTYSNVDAFRQMLYRDSLGPYITALEQAINVGLDDERDGRELYIEAALEAKLRGSFIEQAKVLSTATGRPWMTTDEGRARMNLPALGGDAGELVTPLNVVVGGQASPQDGEHNRGQLSGQPATKAAAVNRDALDGYEQRAAQLLTRFFRRQATEVRAELGAKSPGWWDETRWNRELATDLFRIADLVTGEVSSSTLTALGVEPDVYDPVRTYAFLQAVADRIAGQINTATLNQLEEALAAGEPADAVDEVYERATGSRAALAAATLITTYAGFGSVEAAKQATGGNATKTWRVNSTNPRPSHARLDGETVGVMQTFSNGADWPGDAWALDTDEIAGCQCSLVIDIPA